MYDEISDPPSIDITKFSLPVRGGGWGLKRGLMKKWGNVGGGGGGGCGGSGDQPKLGT